MSEIENYLQQAIKKTTQQKQHTIKRPSHIIRNLQRKVIALEEEQKNFKTSLETLTNSYSELKQTYLTLSDALEKNLL